MLEGVQCDHSKRSTWRFKNQKGEELDGMVQKYVQAIRNAGTPIGTSVVMAAAQGIVKAYDRTPLFENGVTSQSQGIGLSLSFKNGLRKTQSYHKEYP